MDLETGTVSARGQICIPADMRESLGIKEGSKILFLQMKDSLVLKTLDQISWEELTRPLVEEMAKSGLKESDVPDIVHRFRKEQRRKKSE